MPTEMGSPLFAGWRSEKDAACVRALRDAGAVIVGKTVTTEFAASEPRGTRNPWNVAHTPGGSSSGSAASVAAGVVSAGLGTQVISSTVRPASYCGTVGFKPTVNALNRQGSHDYQSQSCTGILGASLEDTWQVAYGNRRPRRRRCRDTGSARTQQGASRKEAACARRAGNRRLGRGIARRESQSRRLRGAAEIIGRRRYPHPAQRQEGRGARSRVAPGHRALASLQWVGKPLVPAHHARSRRRQIEPCSSWSGRRNTRA